MKKIALIVSTLLFSASAFADYSFTLANNTSCPAKVVFGSNSQVVPNGSLQNFTIPEGQQVAFYTNGILTGHSQCTTNFGAGNGSAALYFDQGLNQYIEKVGLSEISPAYNVAYVGSVLFDNNSTVHSVAPGYTVQKNNVVLNKNIIAVTLVSTH
jgi:hypothetical protein